MDTQKIINFYGLTLSGKTTLLNAIRNCGGDCLVQDDVGSLDELKEGVLFFVSQHPIVGDNILNFCISKE